MMQTRRLLILATLIFTSTFSQSQSVPANRLSLAHEPVPNLGKWKSELIAYHDCSGGHGCYKTDLDQQSELAIAILRRRVARAAPSEKLALVLDIDETALSNWDEEKQDDFAYIENDWNAWVNKKEAPAIAGTLRLYKEALAHKVDVFFITGRDESQMTVTAWNLMTVGYDHWAGLALRGPHPKEQSVTEFKSAERKKIVDAGYHIILNIGDQMSDLNGSSQAERSVKLPNPFYYIP